MWAGTKLHKMHSHTPPRACRPRYTPVAAGARRRRLSTVVSSHRQTKAALTADRARTRAGRAAPGVRAWTAWDRRRAGRGRGAPAPPRLAVWLASLTARGSGMSLARLAMLALRDPLRRVAHPILLLLDRLSAAPGSPPGARLD